MVVVDEARSSQQPDGVTPLVDVVEPCLSELALAVDRVRLPVDCDVLAGVLAIQDRLAALSSTLVGEIAAADLFEDDGAASMVGWLKDRGTMGHRRATVMSRKARRLRGCPVTHAAWMAGRLSGGHVDAIVANVSDRVAGLWAEHEAGLVPTLASLSATDAARVMVEWRKKADAIIDGRDKTERPNEFHLSRTLDGREVLGGSVDHDGSALLRAALGEAMPAHNREDPIPLSERQAEGLLELARFYLNHHDAKDRKNRPHLNFTGSLEDLIAGRPWFDTETGDPVSPEFVSALACEADVHKVIMNSSYAVLAYGRERRTVPADLRNAIAIRDGGCRWPGCDRPAWATEIHHIKPWFHGGRTDAANLVMLCSKHHHLLHKGEWELVLDEHTNIVMVTKDGKAPRYSRPRTQPGRLIGDPGGQAA